MDQIPMKTACSACGGEDVLATSRIFTLAGIYSANFSTTMVHNLPSWEITPNPDDIFLTCTIVWGGKLLDISILDYPVISGGFIDLVAVK